MLSTKTLQQTASKYIAVNNSKWTIQNAQKELQTVDQVGTEWFQPGNKTKAS